MERTNYSPFSLSGGSWGTADGTDPYLVGEIDRIRELLCASGIVVPGGSVYGATLYITAADLRAETTYQNRKLAYILYLTTEAGGGGGWFRFDTTVSTTDDGADVLKPDNMSSSDNGRWLRIPAS